MTTKLKSFLGYSRTFGALIVGILLGGFFPGIFASLAKCTTFLIQLIVRVVPLLIFLALSPAIATLAKRGLAGRFAGSVVLWYMLSSALAGLMGVAISSVIFGIPFSSGGEHDVTEVARMLQAFGEQGGASIPLMAIGGAVLLGIIAVKFQSLYDLLKKIEGGISGAGKKLSYIMIPVVFCLGITIGVNFGAQMGMAHYLVMVLYNGFLCFLWWLFYVFVIIKTAAKRPVKQVLSEYYVPTAIFAGGTCSSLATLPINLVNVKKYGVRDEVADFTIPFGAVFNMDASALAYIGYAPFVLTYIAGIEVSWMTMLIAWPAIVLFAIASPGLPAGVGTALWSSTLFASMLGLEEPQRSNLIATWLALSSGIPDMFRTATNSTGDGFTAILFDSLFDRFFSKVEAEV
ncbi:dicarboxylate/amino acid:cation symporter [bacterium]|nr:dicarboxylate/amino acid:cation symporter [bacterium]